MQINVRFRYTLISGNRLIVLKAVIQEHTRVGVIILCRIVRRLTAGSARELVAREADDGDLVVHVVLLRVESHRLGELVHSRLQGLHAGGSALDGV